MGWIYEKGARVQEGAESAGDRNCSTFGSEVRQFSRAAPLPPSCTLLIRRVTTGKFRVTTHSNVIRLANMITDCNYPKKLKDIDVKKSRKILARAAGPPQSRGIETFLLQFSPFILPISYRSGRISRERCISMQHHRSHSTDVPQSLSER
jgi:hypothetical protein